MNKLDGLLTIEDRSKRISALLKYARSLGVDSREAKDHSGQYNEEKLAILIFDAEQYIKKAHINNIRFGGLSLIIVLAALLFITNLPKIMFRLYNEQKEAAKSREKVFKGYDKKGKPVIEDGQPVLFRMMEGVYYENDADGNVKYENHYKNGQVVRRKEFNIKGEVIAEKSFPQAP